MKCICLGFILIYVLGIILIFIYVSVKNLISFNDTEREIIEQRDSYNSFLIENEFDDTGFNLESDDSSDKRFELVI